MIMIGVYAFAIIASSASQLPQGIKAYGPSSDGMWVEIESPESSQSVYAVFRFLNEQTLVKRDLFTIPFWQAYTGCKTLEEFLARNPGSAETGEVTRFGSAYVRRKPLQIEAGSLKISWEVRNLPPGWKSSRFTLHDDGGRRLIQIGDRRYAFATAGLWPEELMQGKAVSAGTDDKRRYGVALIAVDTEERSLLLRVKPAGVAAGLGMHPNFALWDTVTLNGSSVVVTWDPSWSLTDRGISMSLGIPLRFEKKGAKLVAGKGFFSNLKVEGVDGEPDPEHLLITALNDWPLENRYQDVDYLHGLIQAFDRYPEHVELTYTYKGKEYRGQIERIR
ncbi:MAG: hypothetical protein SFX74_12595 [Fimbriimonadaceae bacterium]|nr:hypothetical protein [Fimbriimonadaceae bacterium]